jgi:hypothetical protein
VVADDRKPAKGAVQEVDSPPPSDEVSEGVPDDRTGSGGGDDSSQWHGAREAATPPRITAISPGKTKPTKAEASRAGRANTRARTGQPGSVRIRSVMLARTPTLPT